MCTYIGLGFSIIHPCIFVMINNAAGLTSLQAAMITVGDTIGLELGPVLASFLLCLCGHMSILYMTLVGCLIQCFIALAIAITISSLNEQTGLKSSYEKL